VKHNPHFTTPPREANPLLALTALALFIGAAAIWLQILLDAVP
jgi:hypothetical protein